MAKFDLKSEELGVGLKVNVFILLLELVESKVTEEVRVDVEEVEGNTDGVEREGVDEKKELEVLLTPNVGEIKVKEV